MAEPTYPPLQITKHWADLTDHLIEIVEAIPEDKLNWSPSPELWNFKGILFHIMGARHGWLADTIRDGEGMPDYIHLGQTKEGLKEQLRLSWERMARFLSDPKKLDAVYEPPSGPAPIPPYDRTYLDPPVFNGYWIAYHRMVHDIQHRGDILGYLEQLGIELPPDRRRRPF